MKLHSIPTVGCLRLVRILLLGMAVIAAPILWAQTAPQLVSVAPADGASEVGVTDSLVFVFDQEMDVTVPIFVGSGFGNVEIAPASAGAVVGTWQADLKTLVVDPVFALPLNVTISWRLNPAGTLFPIKSKAGVSLASVAGSFTTGLGDPALAASIPADDAFAVSPDVTVVFRFTQVMNKETALGGNPPTVPGAVSWSGTGVDPAKFIYTWSSDGRQLACDYAENLPPNTVVNWSLNPAAAAVKLESATGKLLPSDTYSGRFTTAESVPCNISPIPPTWGGYGIVKRSTFWQGSGADPVPQPESEGPAFLFSAVVQSPAFGPTTESGSLTRPDGTQNALTNLFLLQAYWILETEAELDAEFPPGSYTLRFTQTGRPEWAIPMAVPANSPPVPKVVNFGAAQQIEVGADFTLQWNAFTGAAANDFISMYISDNAGHILFQAPNLCIPRELPVTATSIVIPANTLQADRTYSAEILFGQSFYFSTNTIPEMHGYGNTIRATRFPLATGTGGGTTPATLGDARLLPNGHPAFDLTGTPARSYGIQRATRLAAANWSEIGTVTLDGAGQGAFEDTQPGGVSPLFYRAVGK